MATRVLLILAACAACAAALTATGAGAHRLPQAPRCPILPASNPFNQRVDTLPVAANSATLINSIGADSTAKADFGSGTYDGGPIGIPYKVVTGKQQRVPVSFEYAGESDKGPYPIPSNAPIEGGPNADGDRHVLVVDKDRCRLSSSTTRTPKASAGAPARARSSTSGPTACDPPAGHPPTPPACRSCPASRATARSRRGRSTTRSASRRAARAARTSPPRVTSPRATTIPRCRRWACACASSAPRT